MKKIDSIVILSNGYWSDNAVSSMHISSILSKKYKLIYIETLGSRFPNFREVNKVFQRLISFFFKRKFIKKGLNPNNAIIYSPLAIPYHKNKIINSFNNFILFIQLRKLFNKHKIVNPIFWVFTPRWESILSKFPYSLLVFHCVDAHHTYDDSDQFIEQLNRVLKKSDIVFTPGVKLAKELKIQNKNTFLIGHGSGIDHLKYKNKKYIPSDIKNLKKPVVVYSGTLANWVDYDLLIGIAQKLPNISFLLIGYIHALAPLNKVSKLLKLKNIFHVGYKNYSDLPSYYANCDLGIVPYNPVNEHIIYSTPTKFLDYCAAGLPIVSTKFPAAISLRKYVTCADSIDDFCKHITNEIKNKNKNDFVSRKKFSNSNSWENQVARMIKKVNSYLR